MEVENIPPRHGNSLELHPFSFTPTGQKQNARIDEGTPINTERIRETQKRYVGEGRVHEWESAPLCMQELEKIHRFSLVEKVKHNIHHPSGWLELLAFDLNVWKLHTTDTGLTKSVRSLYNMATTSMDIALFRKHADFFKIWLGYAKFHA
jgi:hypothetical protein